MPRFVQQFFNRLTSLFKNDRKQRELDLEIQGHLELVTEENIASGMSPEEAKKEALMRFGGVEQLKEECRDAWGMRIIMELLRDIRFSVYSLLKSPVMSLAVIGTLALCIVANTTVLSALYNLVLKPLPFEEPKQLVQLFNVHPNHQSGNLDSRSSWVQYADYRERSDLFEGCALRTTISKVITRDSSVRRVKGHSVSAEFFDLMRVKPLLGRFFTEEEVDPGPGHVVVLTQTTWENEYDSDTNVIGKEILFDDGLHYIIVGVAPRSMEVFDHAGRFFIPYPLTDRIRYGQGRYGGYSADLWVRPLESVNHAALIEQLHAMERRWYEEVANNEGRAHAKGRFDHIELGITNPLKRNLGLLEGGVLFVLLVGCFNVAILLLTRTGQRCHELSIRRSLGAGMPALRRLMLIESLLLVSVSIVVGLIFTWGSLPVVNGYLTLLDATKVPISLNLNVLVSVLAFTGVLAVVIGLIPIELLWRSGLFRGVGSSSRTTSAGLGARKWGNRLVVGQIALTFILLIAAGLLFRSFDNVSAVDPGFDATRVIKGRIDGLRPFYPQRQDTLTLRLRIGDAMKEIPGVEKVSFSLFEAFVPTMGRQEVFALRGVPLEESQLVNRQVVSREYFATMGIKIVGGRGFEPSDGTLTFIVDEAYAERVGPDHSIIGNEMAPAPGYKIAAGFPWWRVVGIASRANIQGQERRDGPPVVYMPMRGSGAYFDFTFLLRTSRPTAGIIKEIQAKLREIDPRLPVLRVGTLQKSLDDMLVARKGITLLTGAFAGIALILSIMGIYAVLSHNVQQRRKEIGIRSALGASRGQLLSMVLRQGLTKAIIGLALGAMGAIATSHYLSSQLFDVTPFDPLTYLAVATMLFLVGLTASYFPARRAANVDPLKTLTAE